MVPLIKAALF